jgi:molecular chaperone DnaK
VPYHLGIDVGTTWTAAAIGRDGRVETATLGTRRQAVPSVVCLTDERLLVGEPAARRAVTDPRRVAREFKRRVGDPTPLLLGGSPVSAELCMARTAEWVVAQVAATEGEAPASLTLTHPANWGDYKLDLYRQALRHVGLTADHFVPEPVAAATAYTAQRPLAPGTVVAVYDLGGGTFDAALVRAGDGPADAQIVGRPDGIERMGGADFDHAVFTHVVTSIGLDLEATSDADPQLATGLAQLRASCVEAKEALSEETNVSIPVLLPQRHTEVLLTRRELEAMIGPAIEETVVALRRAVTSAGIHDDEVAAVLLVGGSSRIPLVGQLVGARLGRPIAVDARPKDAICSGAARMAMAAAPSLAPLAAPVAQPGPPLEAPGDTADPPPVPPAPGRDTAARTRRIIAAALAAVIVAAAIGIVALTREDGDDATTATTTTTGGGVEDPTTTDGSTSTTTSGSGSADILPLPGDDWSDAARAQFLVDCEAHLGNFLDVGGLDNQATCGCVYDEASSDPAWTFGSFDATWSADDVDPGSDDFRRFMGHLYECSGLS